MSYDISLKGQTFDRGGWLREIQAVFAGDVENSPVPLSGLCHQISELEEDLDREQVWLHPVDGVRGVFIKREEDTRLTLPAASSLADFRLTWELVRLARKHGAEAIDESEKNLEGTEEEMAGTHNEQARFFHAITRQQGGDGDMRFPVGPLMIGVPKEDAAPDVDWQELERRLVDRMNRYSSAFLATLMQYGEKDSTERRFLSVYPMIPTLVDARSQSIMISGDNPPPGSEGLPIPIENFRQHFPAEVEDLENYLYIPELDPVRLLLLVAMSGGVPAAPQSPAAATGPRQLDDAEWTTLAMAPILVFMVIASADGSVDKKEFVSFAKIMDKPLKETSPLVNQVRGLTVANFEALTAEVLGGQSNPGEELKKVVMLLRSGVLPEQDARALGRFLYELGETVASASGGFLGFGSKISKEERQRLDQLKRLLVD